MLNKNLFKIALFSILFLGFVACDKDNEEDLLPAEILKESYTIDRFKVLNIATALPITAKLTWSINDSIISENAYLDFISPFKVSG